MNKLFKKIAGLAFGFSLAIAGGSAAIIHSSRGFDVAKADGTAISVSDLVDGDRCFITANNYVLKASTFTAKKSGNSTEAYDGNGLSEASAWLFTQVDTNGDGTKDSWTISYNNGKSYLYVTKDNNGLVSGTPSASATNNKYWTITATGEGTTAYLVANDGTNNRYLALYGNTNFRCYTSTSNGTPQIQLYRYVAPSKTVTSLEITNNPTKMTYEEGEKLDLTGLVVTANWSDGTKTDCTAEAIYSISSGTVLSASDAKITITYGGKSVILTITVSGLKYSTEDLYLTAEALGLTASYGTTDIVYSIGGLDFKFGRTDVMKGTNFGDSIQFKASTGKLYNKSQFSAKLSKIYLLADADNDNAPSNYAVYAPTTMGGTDNALEIVTEDATNRVYSVDFSGGEYYNFTLAKTGRHSMIAQA